MILDFVVQQRMHSRFAKALCAV